MFGATMLEKTVGADTGGSWAVFCEIVRSPSVHGVEEPLGYSCLSSPAVQLLGWRVYWARGIRRGAESFLRMSMRGGQRKRPPSGGRQ